MPLLLRGIAAEPGIAGHILQVPGDGALAHYDVALKFGDLLAQQGGGGALRGDGHCNIVRQQLNDFLGRGSRGSVSSVP